MSDKPAIIETMEEIAAAVDVEYIEVEGFVPGRPFRIGSLTAGDLIEWTEANEGEAKRVAGLRLIVKSLVNAKNERYACANQKEMDRNISILRTKTHKVTERIVENILELNGMKVKGKAVDDAKKG